MTIIELLIALIVLAVGMAGTLVLFTIAMASNNRNKIDTQAVLISQMFLEQIAASSTASFTLADCNANSITVTTAAGGAALDATTKNIDWTQATGSVPAGYLQSYVSCASTAGTQATFEVRWNIAIPAAAGLTGTKLITVSTRLRNTQANGLYIAVPITLHIITGT